MMKLAEGRQFGLGAPALAILDIIISCLHCERSLKWLAILSFSLLPGVLAAEPKYLSKSIIDKSMPYLSQVEAARSAGHRYGPLPSIPVSAQMFSTLAEAIAAAKTFGFRETIRVDYVAELLESEWLWWAEEQPQSGMRYAMHFYVYNTTDAPISGIIVEVADRECDFAFYAERAYHVVILDRFGHFFRRKHAAIYSTGFASRPEMFRSSGGSWCSTIVAAF